MRIENTDANDYLRNLRENWNQWRGVLFLDPFAAQVEWSMIEAVARFKAFDTWILFPVSAIARMLPNTRRPEDVSREWEARLNLVYGGDSWKALYGERRQGNLPMYQMICPVLERFQTKEVALDRTDAGADEVRGGLRSRPPGWVEPGRGGGDLGRAHLPALA